MLQVVYPLDDCAAWLYYSGLFKNRSDALKAMNNYEVRINGGYAVEQEGYQNEVYFPASVYIAGRCPVIIPAKNFVVNSRLEPQIPDRYKR